MSRKPDLALLLRTPGYNVKTRIQAVGWFDDPRVSTEQPAQFDTDEVCKRLSDLFIWRVGSFGRGFRQACRFCVRPERPTRYVRRDITLSLGDAEIWFPGKDVVYVAPSHILHYIDAHGYAPPVEFVGTLVAFEPWTKEEVLARLDQLILADSESNTASSPPNEEL